MTPTPPNLTQRLYLHYTSSGRPHQLLFRPSGVQDAAQLLTMATDAATALSGYMLDVDTFTTAEYSGVGSNVRFPLGFTPIAGNRTLAGNIYGDDPESVQYSITGKGFANGIRWRHEYFTAYNWTGTAWPLTNRWNLATAPGEIVGYYNTVLDWYNVSGLSGVQLVTAGSTPPIPNGWVNVCHNGYWQRKQR
jgi:hypothetical protein